MEAILGFFGLTLFVIILALSFIPVIIAAVRKHNDTILIFLLILSWMDSDRMDSRIDMVIIFKCARRCKT